jgi:hypothetical protein
VVSVISEQEYITRIAALERVNAALAEQIDRQSKVVDAAVTFARELRMRSDWWPEEAALEYIVRQYQEELAGLAKDGSQ